jgi:mycofactocin precursor
VPATVGDAPEVLLMADPSVSATSTPATDTVDDRDLTDEELLVEDVSIDGMCGVY